MIIIIKRKQKSLYISFFYYKFDLFLLMKKILLLLTTLFFFSCGSMVTTIIPAEDFKQENIIELPNQQKDKLFIKSNDWMVTTFNDAESVIQFSDKEEGTIIGKYLLQGTAGYNSLIGQYDTRIYAKITIQVKENKARIIVLPATDINIHNQEGKTKITAKLTNIIQSFKTTMLTNKDTNW